MKARVISTNEIVDVVKDGYLYIGDSGTVYNSEELEMVPVVDRGELLVAALQGMLANPNLTSQSDEFLVERCIRIADMTIQKIDNHGKA